MKVLAGVIVAAFLPSPGWAETAHLTADGGRLEIGLPCAKIVSVEADPQLSGRVVLDATAAHPEELAQMDFTGGSSVKLKLRGWFQMAGGSLLSLHGACWRPAGQESFSPTLEVTLRVPPGFALAVDASGDGAYHLAAGGTLDVDSSGSSRIEAGAVTRLSAAVSGSGEVRVASVEGPIRMELSGSGDVTVARARSDDMSVEQSGSSTVRIGEGTVGRLDVDDSGSGQVFVHGTVGRAAVDASGTGDVTIDHLTGELSQSTSGLGQVRVGNRAPD